VTLQNRFGKDTGKLNVTVLDRPGKPTGPIDAIDITGEAMTLRWLPPKDDGGDEVTNYIVEKKDSSGQWVKVGQPIGTSFRVRNLEPGHKYEFRISAENQYGISDPLQTLEPIMAKNPFGWLKSLPFEKKKLQILPDHPDSRWQPIQARTP
jgi:hypothetical protein